MYNFCWSAHSLLYLRFGNLKLTLLFMTNNTLAMGYSNIPAVDVQLLNTSKVLWPSRTHAYVVRHSKCRRSTWGRYLF